MDHDTECLEPRKRRAPSGLLFRGTVTTSPGNSAGGGFPFRLQKSVRSTPTIDPRRPLVCKSVACTANVSLRRRETSPMFRELGGPASL